MYTLYAPPTKDATPRVTEYVIRDADEWEYFASMCTGLNPRWVQRQLQPGSKIYIVPHPTGLAVRTFAKMSRYSPTEAELKVLCTKLHAQGKGYARVLMSQLEELAKRKGYSFIRIESVPDAVSFYETIGYSVVGPDEDSGLVIMKKGISQKRGGYKTRRRRTRRNL